MTIRRASLAACILALAACGDQPQPRSQPLVLEGMPPETSARTTAGSATSAPAGPAAPVDAKFSRERDHWRTSFTLTLPSLPEPAASRVRRAAEVLLFQGYEVKAGDFAATGEAALTKRLIEDPVPADASTTPWYVERSVTGSIVGEWLTLTRVMREYAGGEHANEREDALVIALANGHALDFDALIPAERQEALRTALAAALRTRLNIPAGKQIANLTSDAELPIPLPALTPAGVRFVWNPIELGTSDKDAFVVELPRDVARGLLAFDPWAGK